MMRTSVLALKNKPACGECSAWGTSALDIMSMSASWSAGDESFADCHSQVGFL
jgi:hypothetical protein